jgi:hypothetical protein
MSGSPHSSFVTEDARPRAAAQPPGDARPAGRDGSIASGTSGGASGTSGGRGFWVPYGLIAASVLGLCTINAFSVLRERARFGQPIEPWQAFLAEYSSGLLILMLAPLVYVLLRRHPVTSRRWPLALLAHALASLGFSAAHVAGMVGLRKLGYALMGETYRFGLIGTEFLYEYRKDLFAYLAILASFWVIGRLLELERALAERRAAPAPAAASGLLTLRDGNTTLRLPIADILWVASAGNYVELALADGRKPLIRGTLQGFETTLAGQGFLRVHRSRLVNAARVTATESKESGDFTLRLDDGSQLSGSRRYREGLKALG